MLHRVEAELAKAMVASHGALFAARCCRFWRPKTGFLDNWGKIAWRVGKSKTLQSGVLVQFDFNSHSHRDFSPV
jgi:hypothetical protein